MFTLQGFK